MVCVSIQMNLCGEPTPDEAKAPATPELTVVDATAIVAFLENSELSSKCLERLPATEGLSKLDGGSYLMINGSDFTISGTLGDKKFEILPLEGVLLHPAPTHPGEGCHATFSYKMADKWKVFRDTRWSTNKRYRSLIYFHQDAESLRLKLTPIVDIMPYKPEAPEDNL